MSTNHYWIVELDLPEVVGACTINGNPGYSTPLTCADQTSYTTTIKTHKFTNSGLILAESDIHKCIQKVTETTPKLKAGNGVASRATCSVTMKNFVSDPNPDSPAYLADPTLERSGTFLGKLKARNIIVNKAVRVKYYRVENAVTTLVKTNHYIATGLKHTGGGTWVLSCQDVLYKADNEKSQFPKIITGTLSTSITSGTTSVVMAADIADWTPYNDYTAVVGDDLLMITNATGDSETVTLTVVRASVITLGSRTIFNTPSDHDAGDEVFRGRKFVNADLYDVFEAIFADADIKTTEYDGTGIAAELDTWLPSLAGSIDAIFYEAEDSTDVLDDICATFLLDVWTDTELGKIVLKASSPWNTTTSVLTEGKEITYNKVVIDEPDDLFYSRAFLQYDKQVLLENDDDVNFKLSSIGINKDLEGSDFYDEEKVKKLGKSIILSNKLNNIESADLTTVRSAQRWSNRPQTINFPIEEADLDFSLGDVIEVLTADNEDFAGKPKQAVRTQVTQIRPSENIGRQYKVSTTTFNPFIGALDGGYIYVNSELDINLYTEAGGPSSSGTFTFIFDGGTYGQRELAQAIAVGSFPSGSIINIVLLNGATFIGKGGNGGNGTPSNGTDGGTTILGTNGVTVNIYLNGTTPDFGNGTFDADGYFYASGGGGAGAKSQGLGIARAAGGGGQGCVAGTAGNFTSSEPLEVIVQPEDGTKERGGSGATSVSLDAECDGGAGGDAGEDGGVATGDTIGTPGTAGKAIDDNSGTFNIYTDSETTRFIQGAGDAPNSIT